MRSYKVPTIRHTNEFRTTFEKKKKEQIIYLTENWSIFAAQTCFLSWYVNKKRGSGNTKHAYKVIIANIVARHLPRKWLL